jgi:hypothetical protein
MRTINNSKEFKEVVDDNKFNVTFEKKDNTTRKLYGTLNPKLIPENKHSMGIRKHNDEDKIVPVFDLDINDWRSLDITKIKELNIIITII